MTRVTTASSIFVVVVVVFVSVDGGGRTPGRVVLALKSSRVSRRRFHSDIVRSEDRGTVKERRNMLVRCGYLVVIAIQDFMS
jgi:hypothetical protein